RGNSVALFLPLPGAYPVGHPFVEVSRTDDSLYATEPKPLSYFVAHAGEGEGNPLRLELLDGVQQRVAAGGVDEGYGIGVQQDVLCRRANCRQCGLQPLVEVAGTREEQVAADAPNQQTGEGDRFGVAPDVAIGLGPRQLTEHRAL